jgi:hydrogenase nickel incorporation protein HypA/HybF
MHEYHIVENIVKQVLEKAAAHQAVKVASVTLVIGALSGMEESSVRLYFENFTQGTIAQGALLVVKPVAVSLTCRACGIEFERKDNDDKCPRCCSMGFLGQNGKEFYIENIEIES